MNTKRTELLSSGCVDTGIRDSKGRMIGCVWTLKVIEGWGRGVGALDAPTQVVECCAARDGREFGASFQRETPCPTIEAAFAEVVRRSTTIRKGAMKKAAAL